MSAVASIHLENVSVEFPVFNAASRSLKNKVLSAVTGGAIDRRHDGHIIVRGLDDVTLSIGPGERVGLVGHNGAGKTTLLRVLSGIYTPTAGTATIDGEVVSLINIALGIDPEMTGRENIRLRAAMMGMTRAETKAQFDDIAEFTGLGGYLDMPFRTYSTGMQLRLAFAVSTSVRPQVLIMDEWLSTGDEDFRVKAQTRLREIVEATEILVLASHNRALVEQNCTKVVWLEHGRLRMVGAPQEVLVRYFGR